MNKWEILLYFLFGILFSDANLMFLEKKPGPMTFVMGLIAANIILSALIFFLDADMVSLTLLSAGALLAILFFKGTAGTACISALLLAVLVAVAAINIEGRWGEQKKVIFAIALFLLMAQTFVFWPLI